MRLWPLGDGTALSVRDCGCAARWAGDELTVKPCDVHRLEWVSEVDQDRYAGPPTLITPAPTGNHHGVN